MNNNTQWKVCVKCFTYNQASYITDAMNGFTMQQTDFPFVCCIVDDASTDGEQEVIRKYVEEHFDQTNTDTAYQKETDYARIAFARHKSNRNCYFAVLYLKENHYSIKKSKNPYLTEWTDMTPYIAICEGDDYWISPLKLQKQVECLEEHEDFLLCGTNGLVLYDEGTCPPAYFHSRFTDRELTAEEAIYKWPFPTASLLFRNKLLEYSNNFSCRIYSGDIRLIWVALAHGIIWSMKGVYVVYRLNGNENSMTNRVKQRKDHGLFYFSQILELCSGFNEYSQRRYNDILERKISNTKKLLSLIRLRSKIGILAFFFYPCTACKYVFKSKCREFASKIAAKVYIYQ